MNEPDLMSKAKERLDKRLDDFTSTLSFKGQAVRFYTSGKRLYLKTTKHLYQVLPKETSKFRLKIMRTYGKDNT